MRRRYAGLSSSPGSFFPVGLSGKPGLSYGQQSPEASSTPSMSQAKPASSLGGGRPLESTTRSQMESRFGRDFAAVRVHTDATAANSAKSLAAQAYTTHQHIVFGANQYRPQTRSGQALLAHELTHAVQQATPGGRGAAASQLEQEADTNAASVASGQAAGAISAAQPGLQMRRMQRFEGTPVARLSVTFAAGSYTQDLVAALEVVPTLESPDSFNGFENQSDAVVAAERHPTITIILRDRNGLFHVFDTQFPSITLDRDTHYSITPYELDDVRFVRWVNVESEEIDPQAWRNRHNAANYAYEQYRLAAGSDDRQRLRQEASEAYVALIMQALDVPRDRIHIASGRSDRQPGMINFDIDMAFANGEAGIAGSLPATREGEAPPVTLTLGRGAVQSGIDGLRRADILTRMTYLHESAHVEHAQLAIDLRQQWRESGATATFQAWLQQQMRRRRISRIEYALALEQVRGGEHATQTVAYLEGFVSGFQQLPVDTPDIQLFHQLIGMSEHWAWAGHALNDRTIEGLHNYYCRVMDDAHRERFSRYVEDRFEQTHGGNTQPQFLFYQRLKQAIETACSP